MCGRFSLVSNAEVLARFFAVGRIPDGFIARYNIAPTQRSVVVYEDAGRGRQAALWRWGLIPRWAKDISVGQRMINARSETLDQRPAFRQAYQYRRCVIPASGFFEWHGPKGKKTPFYFRLDTDQLFGLAGLWEEWLSPEGDLRSFTIITTEANAVVRAIHHRMPVIFRTPDEIDQWLDHSRFDAIALQRLLAPRPIPGLKGYEVSRRVNSAVNDDPQCIEPVEDGRRITNPAPPR
ncbi:MAG: SOS response-associated peptidase [Limnochordia bacterium]|jgi:putative SOS response-associated peptidase YedK